MGETKANSEEKTRKNKLEKEIDSGDFLKFSSFFKIFFY